MKTPLIGKNQKRQRSDKTMKIAFVAQPFDGVLPPHQNSIGLIIYHTARQLAREAQVTVYLAQREGIGVQQLGNVTYRPVPTRGDHRLMSLARRIPGLTDRTKLLSSSFYSLFYAVRVALDARIRSFDIIHILNFSQFAPLIKRFNRCSKVALEMQCEWLEQIDRTIIERRLRSVDLITGDSDHIVDGIRSALPKITIPVVTTYNGFDAERFTPLQEPDFGVGRRTQTALFVGRVSPEKGVHLLLEAFAKVLERLPTVRLVVAGPRTHLPLEYISGLSNDRNITQLTAFYDGTISTNYNDYIDKRAIELGIMDKIEFTGSLPQEQLPAVYRGASVLVNPSFSESFGMSLVEAMAVGRPVVGTRVGGMKEIVEHGVTGFLVESGDTKGLTEALVRLLTEPELAADMGRRGRERALERFSWPARTAVLKTTYDDLLRSTVTV